MDRPADPLKHRPYEDVLALVTGTLFVSLGVVIFRSCGFLTGGTAGIAFLIHYASGWNLGAVFWLINLPFYWLAFRRMGGEFTLKTFASVGLLALMTNVLPMLIHVEVLNKVFASVLGGWMMGIGMLILFRHHASLGGFNVLALYLQEKYGLRAGLVQMALDCAIVLLAFLLVSWQQVALSVLGAVALNQTLATNHRSGRYVAI